MEYQQFLERLSPFIKRNLFPLALGFFGLIFLGYGLIYLIGRDDSASDKVIFESGNDQTASTSANKANMVIDIEGAVIKPGIYSVSQSSRVSDALVAAGGLSDLADREWIAKNFNLAVKLTDGAKIYIPRIGDLETESTKGIKSIKGGDAEDKININTASEQTLDSLPGVGPVTAQKIIQARPYGSIDELLSKKVVNNKVFEQIKEKITAY